jgi:hypothetical protein
MRNDRGTKVLLAMIAIGLWGLLLSQANPVDLAHPAEAAVVSTSAAPLEEQMVPPASVLGPVAAVTATSTATQPLRWMIPTISEDGAQNDSFCSTVVTVRNLTPNTVDIEVEWIDWSATKFVLRPLSVPSQRLRHWVTDDLINIRPYYQGDTADLGLWRGYANVHASDPRILVSGAMLCRDGTAAGAKILANRGIASYPVGSTLEYFQAGMPSAWAPLMVEPEAPE